MQKFEYDYLGILKKIILEGELREGRNGQTRALFGETLVIPDLDKGYFPLLQSRKIFYKGVFGELAAFVRGPKTIKDFENQGCNYWKQWGKEDGTISVDYGNAWLDFDGVNQLEMLISGLKGQPYSRRHLLTGWNPSNLSTLDLPCCHYAYQWYVTNDGHLDMLWHQRSADWIIGVPSDIVLAAAMNIALASEVDLQPGKITMTFGDCHIYASHFIMLPDYKKQTAEAKRAFVDTSFKADKDLTLTNFEPHDLVIENYNPQPPIKFKLEA